MSEQQHDAPAADGQIAAPFGPAFETYPAAWAHADRLTAETADPYAVVQHFGNRLFAVVEGRLADQYVTRYHAAIRNQTDPTDWRNDQPHRHQ